MRGERGRISLGMIMAMALLVLAGALLFFYHLGKTDFYTESPARVAVYARQMNLDNDWALPVLRGQPRIDVPPLYLWAVKLAASLGPEVTALHTRLPGALAALLLTLLAAYWMMRHVSRYEREDLVEAPAEGFALLVGLMLVTSPALIWLARKGAPHTLFTLVYVAAAYCWGESLEARRSFYAGRSWRSWIVYGYALAGVAMLAQGPLVLLLLCVPYVLAARSYHLHRPDWIHLLGLLLALAIGGVWPLVAGLSHPGVAGEIWREWLTLRLGGEFASPMPFYEYLGQVLLAGLPWIVLALIMAVRVWRKIDRSPTLVFWTCALAGNLIVLTALSQHVGRHLLPVMVFTVLLAGDGLYRWNFERVPAAIWRSLLRAILVLAFALGIFASLLLNSELGLTLFILLPCVWLVWTIYTWRRGMHYTPWENSTRLAAMMMLVIGAAEGAFINNWEPRWTYHNDTLNYYRGIRERLDERDERLLFYRPSMNLLYDYYLGVQPVLNRPVDELRVDPERRTFLFADRDMRVLNSSPRLDPEAFNWGSSPDLPREGMFRVLPAADLVTTPTATANPPARAPLRVALLGNTGTRSGGAYNAARRLSRYDRGPLDHALLLGNNIYGPSVLDHLDFIDSFETPFRRLLRRGVLFHAALGHEDQSYAWLQMRYPPFHMHAQRYYAQTLEVGLVDAFMLDSERLYQDKMFDEAQLAWLERALADSRAPWKVVGLNRALLSASPGNVAPEELAARLLPLFDRHSVRIVAWAGGRWYERLSVPGHAATFINAGWSGGDREARFQPDPRLQKGYDQKPGFVVVEFSRESAVLRAINSNGLPIDEATITLQ